MSQFKKAEVEIHYFEEDIITASDDHDNGFIGSDDLARAFQNMVEKLNLPG